MGRFNLKNGVLSRRTFLAGLGLSGAAILAGCGQREAAISDAPIDDGASSVVVVKDDAAASEAGGATSSAGKTLVAYFSATGNTARVAGAIAAELGADLFEIVPAEPYTDDDLNYNDDASRVCLEHDDESLRDVALEQTTPDGWADYTTVYLGYPIWWGIAAWPTNNFIRYNDLAGKTMVPFCTSASSGIGDSAEQLAGLAAAGMWVDGQRFASGVSDDEVVEWVRGL